MEALGSTIIGWDLEWRNSGSTLEEDGKSVIAKVEELDQTNKTVMEKKIVILMHNFAFEEAQNKVRLFKFIEGLKRRGYKFETVATLAVTEKPDDYVYEEY